MKLFLLILSSIWFNRSFKIINMRQWQAIFNSYITLFIMKIVHLLKIITAHTDGSRKSFERLKTSKYGVLLSHQAIKLRMYKTSYARLVIEISVLNLFFKMRHYFLEKKKIYRLGFEFDRLMSFCFFFKFCILAPLNVMTRFTLE